MSDWLAYSLSDLLMFSPRVYYRLFESYNGEVWPAQILTIALGLAFLYLILRPTEWSHRAIAGSLGALWIWIAWAFLWERFATINWPVTYLVPLFVIQGALLIWSGTIRRRLVFSADQTSAQFAGLAVFSAAVVLYPLVAPLVGRSLLSAETFGLAPDPTSIATLALLAIAQGSARWLLMAVPLLWCLISAVTLWTMEAADFFVPLVGGIAALVVAIAGAGLKRARPQY